MKGHNTIYINSSKEGVTYIDGLGFVSARKRKSLLHEINIMANLICLLLITFFLCKKFLLLPLTYLTYYLGFNIRINPYTGLIVTTDASRIVISSLTEILSLLLVILIGAVFCRKYLAAAKPFARPQAGVFPIAFPLCIAAGVLALALGFFFGEATEIFGIILYEEPNAITSLNSSTIYTMAASFTILIMKEIFFHGILLTPLRRFGDGFAAVAVSLLIAACSGGPVQAISSFLLSICISYFVIRSGSVYIAILSRIILQIFIFASQLLFGYFEKTLAEVCFSILCLGILVFAIISFLRYVSKDSNAFRLVRPSEPLGLRVRLGAFAGSFGYILLIAALVFRFVSTVEIIG